MKAAVFYEPNDIRVEEIPEPDDRRGRGARRGRGVRLLRLGRRVLLRQEPGRHGRRQGAARARARVLRQGRRPRQDRRHLRPRRRATGSRSARSRAAARATPAGPGKPQFCANLSVLGVTTNGGFAQFAKTKAAHAYKLPDTLTDEQGAFVEMLAAAVNAVHKAEVQPDDFAVVYGPGPVGLSMVQLLKNEGARVAVVGTGGYRLDVAKAARRRLRRSRAATTSPSKIQRGERRQPRRPGDRRDRLDGREPAGARDLGAGLDRDLHGRHRPGGRGAGADADEPDPGQDDPVLALVPVPVAEDDQHAGPRRGRHRPDHHALGAARRHRCGDRPRRRTGRTASSRR